MNASLPDWKSTLIWPNRMHGLGATFGTAVSAQGLPQPTWVATSASAASALGWPEDWCSQADGDQPDALSVFCGNALWPGMQPWATVYSGHQFGVWAGQLGDGRALLLGELMGPHGPWELQIKGGGRTPYSRTADGRAVLRSSIREFLCSEAMHALGVPTTRALCVIGSPLPVRRETMETAAVVTRAAPSFLRFGHFEHFYHRGQHDALRQLADHTIDTLYPDCRDAPQPYAALLRAVAERTATLIAHWQAVGFCHGVMNTDNMSMLGLTIDYGPFGFLDAFDPHHICNHSDDQGRYAWDQQPDVAWWNLHALAETFLPLLEQDVEQAREAIAVYPDRFKASLDRLMHAKLGLVERQDEDAALIRDWLGLLAQDRVDFTIAHRRLCALRPGDAPESASVRDLFVDRSAFDAWAARYVQRLRAEPRPDDERARAMRAINPRVVLRNHLAESAIRRAQAGDCGEVQRLLAVLSKPYEDHPDSEPADEALPPDWSQGIEVSCSS